MYKEYKWEDMIILMLIISYNINVTKWLSSKIKIITSCQETKSKVNFYMW